MDHLEIVKQVWHITWRYRALWVFGIILALVTASWPLGALPDRDEDWEEYQGITITVQDNETFWQAFRRTMQQEIDKANRELRVLLNEDLGIDVRVNVLVVAGLLVSLVALAFMVATIARYVSKTALIRMVGAYRESGERIGVWRGLRLGWSRNAWRLFLIDLVVDVAAVLASLLAFALILVPLPFWVNESEGIIFTFALLTGGLFFLVMGFVIVAGTAVAVLKRLARQACALEGLGVARAIQQGWQTLRHDLRDTGVTWLVTLVVRLVWSIALAPLMLLLIGLGLIIGGLPAVAAGGLTGLVASAETPIFVALAVGSVIFLLVLVAPLMLLEGLREVFVSALWTLTYSELHGRQVREQAAQPVVDAPGLKAALPA